MAEYYWRPKVKKRLSYYMQTSRTNAANTWMYTSITKKPQHRHI